MQYLRFPLQVTFVCMAAEHAHFCCFWSATCYAQISLNFRILVSFGWSETESTWYVAPNSPIVPAPDDRWWMWSSRGNENWQGKPKNSEKICPSATLSTTNPTWFDLGSNSGHRGGKPAANRLSYSAAFTLLFLLVSAAFELRRSLLMTCQLVILIINWHFLFWIYIYIPNTLCVVMTLLCVQTDARH
jgi:hypothetical protein